MQEFDLITQYFTKPARQTALGVGGDAVLVHIAETIIKAFRPKSAIKT